MQILQLHENDKKYDEIELYVRTYTTLLRSSGEVRIRAFEEVHTFSESSLHEGAHSLQIDINAFAYAAARLPQEMPYITHIILGQSHELFEKAGFDVRNWTVVHTRGRRRPLRYNGKNTLAVFIASQSDIDDLIPMLTAYQIEWNKMHERLQNIDLTTLLPETIAQALEISIDTVNKLIEAFGTTVFETHARILAARPANLTVRMLAASYSQYQRAAQRWWSGIETTYLKPVSPRRSPIYFVSSNMHAIANLVGGAAHHHAEDIMAYIRRHNPEGLADIVASTTDQEEITAILYYLLRSYMHEDFEKRTKAVRQLEAATGLLHLSNPGRIDVDAQILTFSQMKLEQLDPRLRVPGIEHLAQSNACILNIDYPLGMAAYHHLSRIAQGTGEIRGIYVLGKAATLNGRVGDVAISSTVYDEHSQNTFLFKNAFRAKDIAPYLRHGSVFDNQAAVTVRSAFLQNKDYMSHFYKSGYTVLEMEAGPFLSAIYELVSPIPSPVKDVVHLSTRTPFDVGFLHYASDTPYSRQQSLLSKSLSYFGVDSTYACAIAILRRIFEQEIERIKQV